MKGSPTETCPSGTDLGLRSETDGQRPSAKRIRMGRPALTYSVSCPRRTVSATRVSGEL